MAAAERAGGNVQYHGIASDNSTWWPNWLVDRLDVDYFDTVVGVEMRLEKCSDADLAMIGRLSDLEWFTLWALPSAPSGRRCDRSRKKGALPQVENQPGSNSASAFTATSMTSSLTVVSPSQSLSSIASQPGSAPSPRLRRANLGENASRRHAHQGLRFVNSGPIARLARPIAQCRGCPVQPSQKSARSKTRSRTVSGRNKIASMTVMKTPIVSPKPAPDGTSISKNVLPIQIAMKNDQKTEKEDRLPNQHRVVVPAMIHPSAVPLEVRSRSSAAPLPRPDQINKDPRQQKGADDLTHQPTNRTAEKPSDREPGLTFLDAEELRDEPGDRPDPGATLCGTRPKTRLLSIHGEEPSRATLVDAWEYHNFRALLLSSASVRV